MKIAKMIDGAFCIFEEDNRQRSCATGQMIALDIKESQAHWIRSLGIWWID